MRSHIGWERERNILYKGVENPKNLEGKPERESPKKTISTSGALGLGLLQYKTSGKLLKKKITHSRLDRAY